MTIEEKIDRILAILEAQPRATTAAPQPPTVADASDLDGQYGDEEIRKMPSQKYWQGDDFTGRRMSTLPSDFLRAFAKYKSACAYMTRKDGNPEKQKYAGYDDKSAARALGWAARNESRPALEGTVEDSIPF